MREDLERLKHLSASRLALASAPLRQQVVCMDMWAAYVNLVRLPPADV
jgi:hypothetical protein